MPHRALIALTLIAIPSLAGATDTLSALEEEQVALFERIAPAVVAIRRGDVAATGFAVAPGFVVTTAHAVGDASAVEVSLRDGRSFRAEVLERSRDGFDVALLRVDGTLAAVLELSPAPELRTGAVIATIGHGDGSRWSFSTGLVSNAAPAGPDGPLLALQLPLRPGASGGPVVDLSGRVVGIVAHGAPGTIAFAVRSDAALRSLAGLAAIDRELLALAPAGEVAAEAGVEPAPPPDPPTLLVGPADPRSAAAPAGPTAHPAGPRRAARAFERVRGRAPQRIQLSAPAPLEAPPPLALGPAFPSSDGLAAAALLAGGAVLLVALEFAGGGIGSRAHRGSGDRATSRRATARRVLSPARTPAAPPPRAPATPRPGQDGRPPSAPGSSPHLTPPGPRPP